MAYSLESLFAYVPLTEMVQRVKGGLPRVLPAAFYTQTRDIPGDRFRRATFRGTRNVARVSRYGSPPRKTQRVSRGMQEFVMLHSIEEVQAGPELMGLVRKWADYENQVLAKDLLQQDAIEFARRFDNLETASIQAALAYGKLWFDSDGNLQTSSSGADLELDYGIPSGNTGTVGGIIAASWATTSTNIVNHVKNLKTKAVQETGYPLRHVFYGKNVAGYLAANDSFKEYLARHQQFREAFVSGGEIMSGVLDLEWHPVQDAFFVDENDAVQEIFPADQATFYPELSRATYELLRGGYPVPKSFAVGNTLEDVATQVDYVYGPFSYAYAMPGTLQIEMVKGTTFLPDLKVPEAVYLVDTTT